MSSIEFNLDGYKVELTKEFNSLLVTGHTGMGLFTKSARAIKAIKNKRPELTILVFVMDDRTWSDLASEGFSYTYIRNLNDADALISAIYDREILIVLEGLVTDKNLLTKVSELHQENVYFINVHDHGDNNYVQYFKQNIFVDFVTSGMPKKLIS